MRKIRKGDEVVVITGKDKGKRGVVQSVVHAGKKLIIDGINIVKKHVKPNPNTGEKGGVVLRTHPIDSSNVMLYDASSGKGSRVAIKKNKDGLSVRYYKSTDQIVDLQ